MSTDHPAPSMPWRTSVLLGAGSLVIGAVSPLYDTYVPPLLERHVGRSATVGALMGIDNVIIFLLVPLVGALSDATRTRLGRRLPYLLAALPLAAACLAAIPYAERLGLAALLLAMVALDVGIAVWRAPFTALLAELVPSVHRSKTAGMMGVGMCLGAMFALGGGRSLSARDPALPFVLAAAMVGVVWALYAALLREPADTTEGREPVVVAPVRALREAFTAGASATRFFAACLLFQMAFQSFSSWFTLHGSERFGVTVGDASLGFIAVAVSTLLGSLPAGWLGARYGRRRLSLVGFAGMAVACVLLHLAPTLGMAIAACFLFGFSWSIPVANLTPMALELGSAARAGSLAGAFLLVQSAAGVIGPSFAGAVFDVTGSKRPLFLVLALFLAGAFALMATLQPGFGESRGVAGASRPGGHIPQPAA